MSPKRTSKEPKPPPALANSPLRDNPELALPEPLLAPDDDLGEELAEEYLISATSGEQAAEDIRNQETPEENGGPF
ncbi:MAG TPA: hypothetical protein VN918_06490, partial [Myxococcaceae bacterium]|nr:hypothetical protein [Myxococcaceae bacterium]